MDCRIRISWTYTFNGAGPVEIGALVPKGQANVDVVYELLDQSGLNPHKSEQNATINLEENLCEWYC